jgi:hypothetical protein
MQALVPLLVAQEELGPAVALNSLTFNLARAVGPVAGALVVATLGITSAFALNSVSYVALILGLAAIHPVGQAPPPATQPRLRESFRLVCQDTKLAVLLLTVAAMSLCADPVSTLTPGFATKIFHRPDSYSGYLVVPVALGRCWLPSPSLGEDATPFGGCRRRAACWASGWWRSPWLRTGRGIRRLGGRGLRVPADQHRSHDSRAARGGRQPTRSGHGSVVPGGSRHPAVWERGTGPSRRPRGCGPSRSSWPPSVSWPPSPCCCGC